MKSSTNLVLYSLFHYIFTVRIPSCDYATSTKYLGNYVVKQGFTDIDPYFVTNSSNSKECQMKCRNDDQCYAVSLSIKNKCSFYNTTDLNIYNYKVQIFYLWIICDWTFAIQPPDGRCPGIFVRYFDYSVEVTKSYLTLNVFYNTELQECLNKCVLHPLCKAINYEESLETCSLHQLFPQNEEYKEHRNGTYLFQWTCIPSFVEDLFLSKKPKQPNTLKCTGYWEIISHNSTFPDIKGLGVHFLTQSYQICLLECLAHPSCIEALFNVTYSICILPFTEHSNHNNFLKIITFLDFKWVCTRNDLVKPKMNNKEKEYKKMGLNCFKLVNNSNVYIAQDNCGNIPKLNKFVSCKPKGNTKKWTITDSCLVNQSFWAFKTDNFTLRMNKTVTNYITRVFTGLTTFWMVHSENTIYEKVSFLECRRFDGSKSSVEMSLKDIITRHQWYAYKSQGDMPKIRFQPNYIVLSASQEPYFGCRTTFACISLLRNLQMYYFNGEGYTKKFVDIPYNFMLDEVGNIYEGRGWNNACQAVKDLNFLSYCFGFIGSFSDIKPSVKFLQSLKKLIKYAVDNKYVPKDYILYIHQDATRQKIHKNYAIIIKQWYRYRGFVVRDCSIASISVLILSGIVVIIISLSLLTMYKTLHSTKDCKLCDIFHSMRFTQIYPKVFFNYDDQRKHIVENDGNTTQCIVKEREACYIQRSFVKFIKAWFLNKSMQTLSSKYKDKDLGDYLNNYKTFNKTIKVLEARLMNCRGRINDNAHIVLCFTNKHSQSMFEGLTANKLCVCQHFDIDFLSFSDLPLTVIKS